ncbi:MAG: DNA mismatch repair endonuclease MutL [Elusimicrobiota bacterium]|jgi:DNA mismatch repair protein MutL|nr:DNA mismatch repair endonuclease MutL [Elusimicrobiota bacterium]
MNKIKLLDIDTIEKIAAGEVVERPFCAIKELVENSIDANAKKISIEILDKGIKLIKITDDGNGMTREDLELCVKRHATSKIQKIEDLEKIKTLGFRGEALAAISRISKIEIITRQRESEHGFSMKVEGGEIKEIKKIGTSFGTQIIIKDLFYNVPARKKFLKSHSSEYSQIISILEKIAISHPNISFRLSIDTKEKFNLLKSNETLERIKDIFGKKLVEYLLPFKYENDFFSISGFATNTEHFEKTKNNYYTFVNKRNISSKIIIAAINEAYKENIVKSRYPVVFLFLEMNGEFFDVNVHPQKTEIKFMNEPAIFSIIKETIFYTLKNEDSNKIFNENKSENVKDISINEKEKNFQEGAKEIFLKETLNLEEGKNKKIFSELKNIKRNYDIGRTTKIFIPKNKIDKNNYLKNWKKIMSIFDNMDLKKIENLNLNQNATSILLEKNNMSNQKDNTPIHLERDETSNNVLEKSDKRKDYATNIEAEFFDEIDPEINIIGWLPNKYILANNKNFDLILIDQHASHERINYEILKKDFENRAIEVQGLLLPEILEIQSSKMDFLIENIKKFENFGFFIEYFGNNIFKITGVPSIIEKGKEIESVREILDNIIDDKIKGTDLYSKEIIEKIIMIACKNSIKANQKMSFIEMQELVKRLMKTENPYHCPHGRPTIISMTQKEIDKKFSRIL